MENSIEKLAHLFKEFPGIGERQARRFVYFILHKKPEYISELVSAITSIKKDITQCSSCFIYFQSPNHSSLCEICSKPSTDKSVLLVVEKDADIESIKRSNSYKGMYFILGGLVPIVTKETPQYVRIKELIATIKARATEGVLKEIIIAFSLSPQGEHTDMYIREICNELAEKYKLKITSFGRGLSTGSELEYADRETIKNAIQNRS